MSGRPVSEFDRQTVARLTGAARRHAPWREPTKAETAAAVDELQEIASDRSDLLAEVAGLLIGFYRRTAEEPKARAAARYCMAAGADPDLIPRWIEVGRRRATAARQVPDARAEMSAPRTGLEAYEPSTGPETSRPPGPTDLAGLRQRQAPRWRSRAGRNRWRTFRFNM